jgi:tetratricopeptide (TPR) repeat protein
VSRTILLALFLTPAIWAQDKPKPQQPPKEQQEPPEEDESLKPKEYTFNPLQASKEVTIGNYYFKKGNFRAAAKRFTEATHWNPGMAEAYLRLGETEEKLKDKEAARTAYAKYVELAPDAKNVDSIRKKLASKR